MRAAISLAQPCGKRATDGRACCLGSYFLAWSGIVSTAAMARSRRYVLLAVVIGAAMLTPPDVISQILLAGPMFFLFEVGIFVARFVERKKETAA